MLVFYWFLQVSTFLPTKLLAHGPTLYNFYGRNLQMFVIILSICPWQAFSA